MQTLCGQLEGVLLRCYYVEIVDGDGLGVDAVLISTHLNLQGGSLLALFHHLVELFIKVANQSNRRRRLVVVGLRLRSATTTTGTLNALTVVGVAALDDMLGVGPVNAVDGALVEGLQILYLLYPE